MASLPLQLGKNGQDGGVADKTKRHGWHRINRLKILLKVEKEKVLL